MGSRMTNTGKTTPAQSIQNAFKFQTCLLKESGTPSYGPTDWASTNTFELGVEFLNVSK